MKAPYRGAAPVEAGQRDCLVTIEAVTDSVGPSGFPVETWTVLGQAWMGRVSMAARERFATAQTTAYADTRWYLPYRADMDPDTIAVPKVRRLVYQGRVFDIVAATMIGRRLGIELTTLAKVDA